MVVLTSIGIFLQGTWAGEGIKKRKPRKPPALQVPKKKAKPRRDANLKNVIIAEKRDKKAHKFQTTAPPFPFQTAEQYENSTRNPIGNMWNTQAVFEATIKPRVRIEIAKPFSYLLLTTKIQVTTKAGTIIEPMQQPLPKKQTKKVTRGQKRKKKLQK